MFNNILVLQPDDKGIERRIGSLVVEAYSKRDKANFIEEKTVKLLENTLMELAE